MLKAAVLAAMFLIITVETGKPVVRAILPIAVAFQFKNNANESASIRNISKNQETTWSEELVEVVLSNGGLLQSRLVGSYKGIGGSFLIAYNSGDVFKVTAVFGGGVANNCTVVKQQNGTSHVTMKAESKVQGRVMTCSLKSLNHS